MKSTFSKFWNSKFALKRVGIAAWAGGMVSILINGYFETNFLQYPKSPDQSTGRVVAHDVKGLIHFITERELRVVSISLYLSFICIFIFILITIRYQRLKRKSDYSI